MSTGAMHIREGLASNQQDSSATVGSNVGNVLDQSKLLKNLVPGFDSITDKVMGHAVQAKQKIKVELEEDDYELLKAVLEIKK